MRFTEEPTEIKELTPLILGKVSKYLCGQPNVLFAYLTGSYANGKPRLGSDIDIALFFRNSPGIMQIGEIVCNLEEITGISVDLIELNNLYNKNTVMAYTIVAEGVFLFTKDGRAHNEFKKLVFLFYLDFQPMYERMKKAYDPKKGAFKLKHSTDSPLAGGVPNL